MILIFLHKSFNVIDYVPCIVLDFKLRRFKFASFFKMCVWRLIQVIVIKFVEQVRVVTSYSPLIVYEFEK